jgi:hypothetical protein
MGRGKKKEPDTFEEQCDDLMQSIADETGATIIKGASVGTNGEFTGGTEINPTDKPPVPDAPADPAAQMAALEAYEQEVAEAENEWNALKEQCKEAKSVFDGKVATLRRMIRAASNDEDRPLLSQMESNGHADPEAWRAIGIETLGLSTRIGKALTEGKLGTIGAIADWTKQYRLMDVKGIGEAAAEELGSRLDSWWAEHPEYAQEQA